jgi:hypothetical protein
MKRWTTILGRGGTTLIAISLALLIVSFIPQTQSSSSKGSMPIRAGQFSVMFSPGTITPQQEVQVNITVKGTLTIYLLEINARAQFMNGTFGYEFNLTDLQELLKEHPEQIPLEHEVENSGYKLNYTPSKIMNATVAVYNNASETATLEFDMALKSSLAPGDKVRTIAYFAAPIGVIMAVPWLLSGWKQRKNKLA